MLFSTSIPQYDLPQSPILIIGFFGIFFTLVLLYFVNRAYFDSPLNEDKRGYLTMKTLLNEIHDIIEQGDNGTPHDLIDVMFNLLDVNQLTQLEDIIVNQYGEN